VKGNTQAWPEAGPLEVVQLPEEAVVVVVEVVVVEVVEAVVVEVLTVVVEEVVVEEVVVVEVVVVVVELAEGQVEGQKPYLSVTKLPPASTSVEHQAALWSTVAHSLYTTPLYLNGKTQALPVSGPEAVVQEGTVMASSVQPEVVETEQSPQLLVITLLLESTPVAHQALGESV
jgi:hypothetical protein